MNPKILIINLLLTYVLCIKTKPPQMINNTSFDSKNTVLAHHKTTIPGRTKPKTAKWNPKNNKPETWATPTPGKPNKNIISPEKLKEWASLISEKLVENEQCVVRREMLIRSFSGRSTAERSGAEVADAAAAVVASLLSSRATAAEAIMKKAEELAETTKSLPSNYLVTDSIELDEPKKKETMELEDQYRLLSDCRGLARVPLQNNSHFNADVSLDTSSVHVAAEVFYCSPSVLQQIYWSQQLLSTFRQNYANDAMIDFQYFCGAKGFLRHYPAASWESIFNVHLGEGATDVYDCRLRPWYVSGSGAPRDVLILFDASGSMVNSSNLVVATQFTLTLLNALTDDDQVNVIRFSTHIRSTIPCFNDRLVPANHVNTAAVMEALGHYPLKNESYPARTLQYAVNLLQQQRSDPARPSACQQAIVLITDSLYENFTDTIMRLDPDGEIRLFIMWLHDPHGLRDSTRKYANSMTCARDGYYAELITASDVTEQVMRILRVLERPLVAQRKKRLRVFSDVYAHGEDPRRSEYYWNQKENKEQVFRYQQLRLNKERLLNGSQPNKDFEHQIQLDEYGQYYEKQTVNYRLQISVSVPVFDYTTEENITIQLDEENQRNSTRTYPVNRLLGVAGVDIPIDHLKLFLPYHKVGSSGSLIMLDHRGNIVFHENIRPVFDGDILKPGYRTVDFLDVEQPAAEHLPREYPHDWLELRKDLIVGQPNGTRTMYAKIIFDDGMRALLEKREYHWRRVLDHYTLIVAMSPYNKRYVTSSEQFTQSLSEEALKALFRTDFSIHPDWLYCRHIDTSFDLNHELLFFLRRRSHEAEFPMTSRRYRFRPMPPTVTEKTYICDEELMVRLSRDAIGTHQWAEEHENEKDCSSCQMGSTTAFIATESGLTRWQTYLTTSGIEETPEGSEWPRGPDEPWFRRAMASPGLLVVHAPVIPIRVMRNTDQTVPPVGKRAQWFTAARTLGQQDKGFIGVAGYHFHPIHLNRILNTVTKGFVKCDGDEEECDPRCDGDNWSCVLVDDAGWILARTLREDEDEPNYELEEPREHLATLFPTAMSAMLNQSVFKLHWVHDYQAVCFPEKSSAAMVLPSLVNSVLKTVKLIFFVAKELIAILVVINQGDNVLAETAFEKAKRRRKIFRDHEREKYERLYDKRVLVNRTTFAACDRSRPMYRLQWNAEALSWPANPCTWPLVATKVPDTNLLLIAIYLNCPIHGWSLPNPFRNIQVKNEPFSDMKASDLACSRNRAPLPTRVPHTRCYPHQYSQEAGYRQCGPWLPDPEPSLGIRLAVQTTSVSIVSIISYLLCQV